MTFPLFHYPPEIEPPFRIVVEAQDSTPDGHWRPAAVVQLAGELRTSGFLNLLPPEDFKTFLLLLSFVTPNGNCSPGLSQIAAALRLSEGKARARLQRLAEARWHGQPIVLQLQDGNGLDAFTLTPGLVPVREDLPQEPPPQPLRGGFGDTAIAHSRQQYARPRAEVERGIERQMSRDVRQALQVRQALGDPDAAIPIVEPAQKIDDEEERRLRAELLDVGVLPEQADDLLARFDSVRIRRQLMWLPYRPARNPAGLLIAAIKDDYAAPLTLHPASPDPQTTSAPPPLEAEPPDLPCFLPMPPVANSTDKEADAPTG